MKRSKMRAMRSRSRQRKQRLQLTAVGVMFILCIAFGAWVILAPKPDSARSEEYVLAERTAEIAGQPLSNGVGTLEVSTAQTLAPLITEPPLQTEVPRTSEENDYAAITLPPFAVPEVEEDDLEAQPWMEPEPVSILISAAGDCTLGGEEHAAASTNFRKLLKSQGYDYFFASVRSIFENDDITIVNLEGPLTTSKAKRPYRYFNFKGAPDYVKILTGSSIEVCNIANNHALDYGKQGLVETAEVLEEAGIGASGYTLVHYREVNGVKVGFVGLECWEYTKAKAVKFVEKIRPTCDVLIVSFHWGTEKYYNATKFQKECGRAMIDAGADLVLGHHTHVVGGIEQYKGKYIVYSLGNFCFGGNSNPADKDTMIFQQRLIVDADGTVRDGGINIIPCSLSSVKYTNDFQPTPLTGAESKRVLRKIGKYSKVDEIVRLSND